MRSGGVPERSNGAVLKTVGRASASWVRIPPPPLDAMVTDARHPTNLRGGPPSAVRRGGKGRRMGTIYIDSPSTDDERRQKLYAGEMFVYSPSAGSSELCALARQLSEEAFAPHDPQVAQDHMPPEE